LTKFNVIFLFLLYPTLTSALEITGNSIHAIPVNDEVQRQAFSQTLEQINTKQVGEQEAATLKQEIAALSEYPLYPYLEYELISQQIGQRPASQISDFIERYDDLPFTPGLRRLAIRTKYKARQWRDVIALHKVGNSVNYQCMYLHAQIKTGKQKQALPKIKNIWLNGSSLPKVCDPVLASWSKAGKKTSKLIKQRIELAFKQRNSKLAKFLAKSLDKNSRKTFNYWYGLYRQPKKLSDNSYWGQRGHTANSMMYIAMERLSYQYPKMAAKLLNKLKRHPGFTTTQRHKLINKLALRLITKDHVNDALATWLNELDWTFLNKSQQSQILRHLVGRSQWQLINTVFASSAQVSPATLEWQYWVAIAQRELGQTERAMTRLEAIAKQRRYYGFLASDILKQGYSLNHQTLPIDQAQITQLLTKPHLIRAYQLFKLKRNLEAQREWYYLVKKLTQAQRISAAQIAHHWGWHDRAIITLTMTEKRDDLTLRFPTPYLESFSKEATRNELDLSWPLAIARQESAFMARANSAVGARGLMQLMPGTAKLQAKQSQVLYHQTSQLYTPAYNIKLGTGYLDKMLAQFDNNLAVAAAAYNAGPHRVKHWVTRQLPQAQWVETIPYRETREYVKNVLAYSVIYQQKLSQHASLPSLAIIPERMAINAK